MKFRDMRLKIRKLLLGNQIFHQLMSLKNMDSAITQINDSINTMLMYSHGCGDDKKRALRFVDYLNRNSEEEYINLIQNLDEESIKCINSVLSRAYCVANDQKYYYTTDEMIEYYNLCNKLYKNIIQINDIYIYNSYILPDKKFFSNIFYHKLFMDKVNSIDKIMNKDIIDAGAYIGDSALVLSEYTNKKVYAFEPTKNFFDMMVKTLELNKKTNIVPVHKGLAEKTKKEEVSICNGMAGMDGVLYRTDTKETVEMVSLDEFVINSDIEVGLIKTDLEGFEFPFLFGAVNTIKRFKPVLLLSVYHSPEDFFGIKPWLENLNLGYTFKFYKPLDGYAITETLMIAECV